MRAILLFLGLVLSSPATGQASVEALLDRLNSVDPAVTTVADCERQVAQAASLNALDLFYGASICFAVSRPVEGSFLLNAGQMRSLADLALMIPATSSDADVATSLYGVLYFHAGGPGDESVLRDVALRESFLNLVEGWSPEYPTDYNPGWNTRRRPSQGAYLTQMGEVKAGRQRQLADIIRLLSDETYYALHRRFQDLQARNPVFVEGSPDGRLAHDLQRQMGERSAALGMPRSTSPDPNEIPEPRFPPKTPAADEVVLSKSSDPAVERCASIAEWHSIAEDSRIARVLITRSAEWGVIWRADIILPDRSTTRFTCSSNTSSSTPLDLGDDRIPPLPEVGSSAAGPQLEPDNF